MKFFKSFLFSLIAVLFLAACSEDEVKTPEVTDDNIQEEAAQSNYPKTFTDGRGKEITFTEKPTNIVSTTLAVDEFLADLTATENIAAVTQMSTDASISNIAGKTDAIATKFETVTAEQILALNPGLVIIPSYVSPDVLNQIEEAGIQTFQLVDDSSFEGILDTIKVLGGILGEEEAAQALIADFNKRIATLEEKTAASAPTRVLYYTEYLSSITDNTTIGKMIQLAGGVNVISEAGIVGDAYPDYPNLSKEALVELNPEVIFTTAWGVTEGAPAFVTEWKNDPALSEVAAIKNNKVFVLDGANVTTASHYVIEGAEEMYSVLSQN